MKQEYVNILDRIFIDKAKKYGIYGMKHEKEGNVMSLYSHVENYHLFYTIKSQLDVWDIELQYQIMIENKQFRILIFVDPVPLSGKQKEEACLLVNEINSRYRGVGKFTCNTNTGDFLYDMTFPQEMLSKMPEFVENTIFKYVISVFEAVHVPLIMYSKRLWEIKLAVQYYTSLMDDGYVDNKLYGL